MIMRFQIMQIVSMIVRLESMFRMLVLMPMLVRAVFVRMRMLMDVRMRMLVNMFVRVRHFAVPMLMPMAVHVCVAVGVAVSVVCVHRASPLRPSSSLRSMP
jgi:hypothetical protein